MAERLGPDARKSGGDKSKKYFLRDPERRVGTREERVQKMIADKESRIQGTEHDIEQAQESLESARSGVIHDFGNITDPEGPIREAFDVALGEMIDMCMRIKNAANPQEEARRLIQIVLQRGGEWADSEGRDDARMVLVTAAMRDIDPKLFNFETSNSKILEYLTLKHDDSEFLKRFSVHLSHKRMDLARYRIMNRNDTVERKKAVQESPARIQRWIDFFERELDARKKTLALQQRHRDKLKGML